MFPKVMSEPVQTVSAKISQIVAGEVKNKRVKLSCGDQVIVFAVDLKKKIRKYQFMKNNLTPAMPSDLHRLQPSKPRARAHIFGANYGEVTAWKQTSDWPAWQIPRNWGKGSVASIGSRLRENVNRSPRKCGRAHWQKKKNCK